MAADDRWYFTKEELEQTPSIIKCGYDKDREMLCRQEAADFIEVVGQRIKLSQLCINTAVVYMHRFYTVHSFAMFDLYSLGAAAIFLAAKVEEEFRTLNLVHEVAQKIMHLEINPEHTIESEEELELNEELILQTLGFDCTVIHPHLHVIRYCTQFKAKKELAEEAFDIATTSIMLTTMCLQYKPEVVACFCIHLASKWTDCEIPPSMDETKSWFWYVDSNVTQELIDEITDEFLITLDRCPSHLNNLMKIKQKVHTNKNMSGSDIKTIHNQTMTPSASTVTTAQQQQPIQILKVEDALSYLEMVKLKFVDQPHVYKNFLDIMKEFHSNSIDVSGVIERVTSLFNGHPELIVGFNTFLPRGYKIEVKTSEQGYLFQVSHGDHGTTIVSHGSTTAAVVPPLPPPVPATTPPHFPNHTTTSITQVQAHQAVSQALTHVDSPQPPLPFIQLEEFNLALNYVRKVKNRFQGQPDKYKRFLEILHTYQRNLKEGVGSQGQATSTKQLTEAEVYSQVAKLFEHQEDLLAEFGRFLPDVTNSQTQLFILNEGLHHLRLSCRRLRFNRKQRLPPTPHPYHPIFPPENGPSQKRMAPGSPGGSQDCFQQPKRVLCDTSNIPSTKKSQRTSNIHKTINNQRINKMMTRERKDSSSTDSDIDIIN